MSIVNAVLMISKGAPIWVEDAASIAQWGRIEGFYSVGEIEDPATVERIGEEWLSVRSQPMQSHVVASIDTGGAVGGVDYREGDRLADPDLRVAELSFTIPEGRSRFVSTPNLESKYEEALRRNQSRVDRLIAEGGGAAPVSAPPANNGSEINAGKLQPRQIAVWSWYDEAELDPVVGDDDEERGWQPQPIDEAVRICEIVVECSHVDEDNEVITTGPTRFRLFINGVAPLSSPELGSLPTDVVVPADAGKASIPVFGPTILRKSDTVQVAPITNGGHINGSVTMFGSDVV